MAASPYKSLKPVLGINQPKNDAKKKQVPNDERNKENIRNASNLPTNADSPFNGRQPVQTLKPQLKAKQHENRHESTHMTVTGKQIR